MGNRCCCFKSRYTDLVVSEDVSQLDAVIANNNEDSAQIFEEDIVARVDSPLNAERRDGFSFISHPYICDESVIKHLQLQKTMFVMRGVPGSGKSTLVKEILKRFPKAVVCSADNFWITPDGEYSFDVTKLKDAHNWCRNTAYQACEVGKGHIIIDNTNVKRWEFKYYTDIANRFHYLTLLVEPQTPWRFNPEILFSKCTHNVPINTIEAKVKSYEESPIPLYFAWVPNLITSEMLLKQSKSSYLPIINDADLLRNSCGFPEDVDLLEWYNWKTELHITSMFCDRGKVNGSKEYTREVVSRVGCLYLQRIYGFLFTSRVVAAVVGPLSEQALSLWDNGDNESLPKGSKAHITLATAEHVQAKQSGDDLVRFLLTKQDGHTEKWNDNGLLKSTSAADILFSNEPDASGVGCFVQLNKSVEFTTVFSGTY